LAKEIEEAEEKPYRQECPAFWRLAEPVKIGKDGIRLSQSYEHAFSLSFKQ
jgi:hypothetical protein